MFPLPLYHGSVCFVALREAYLPTSSIEAVLKLLGLGVPFLYAVAAYSFFHLLDENASVAAKTAITDWLLRRKYNHIQFGEATVAMFDRIYGPHLLSFKAFGRSALISSVLFAVALYEFHRADQSSLITVWPMDPRWISFVLVLCLGTNILSDYASLFIVRRLLIFGQVRPLRAALIGPAFGVLIVIAFLLLRNSISSFVQMPDLSHVVDWDSIQADLDMNWRESEWRGMSLFALVVHLWLPLFVLCGALLKCLNYFRHVVGLTQWFLKGGKAHPLNAIGYVAGALVMIATTAMHWLVQ
jgi:uncharacterized membrane protein YkvI